MGVCIEEVRMVFTYVLIHSYGLDEGKRRATECPRMSRRLLDVVGEVFFFFDGGGMIAFFLLTATF